MGLTNFRRHGSLTGRTSAWSIRATYFVKWSIEGRGIDGQIFIGENRLADAIDNSLKALLVAQVEPVIPVEESGEERIIVKRDSQTRIGAQHDFEEQLWFVATKTKNSLLLEDLFGKGSLRVRELLQDRFLSAHGLEQIKDVLDGFADT